MLAQFVILLASAPLIARSREPEPELSEGSAQKIETLIVEAEPRQGDVCVLKRLKQPHNDPSLYFDCMLPTNDTRRWPWKQLGVWVKRQCLPGQIFSPVLSFCRNEVSVRRMQARDCQTWPETCGYGSTPQMCGGQPCPQSYNQLPPMPVQQPCYQPPCPQQPSCSRPPCPQAVDNTPRPCPLAGGGGGGAAGGMCSWMMAPLRPAGSPNQYLQCVPMSGYCGRWIPRPCAPGTRFDARVQVCVHAARQSSCGGGSNVYVGQCNQQQQCPGYSQCKVQTNSCCQSAMWQG